MISVHYMSRDNGDCCLYYCCIWFSRITTVYVASVSIGRGAYLSQVLGVKTLFRLYPSAKHYGINYKIINQKQDASRSYNNI